MAIPFLKLPSTPLHHPIPTPPLLPLHPYPSLLSFPLLPKPHQLHLSTTATTKDDSSLTSLLSDLQDDPLIDTDEFTTRSLSPSHHHHLPSRWPELHGEQDWSGLLDPIDPLLRSELIRYGEFSQACYDAFDFDPFSRYCGSSKYPRRKFFSSLAMDSYGYEVSRFLYATSNINLPNFFSRSRWDRTWSERANWIGYIAVSSDATTALLGRRDIVIAWRGTVTKLEWIADLMDFLRPISSVGIPCPDPSVKVESGFVDLYTDKDPSCRFCKYSAREQVLAEVKKLIDHYAVKNGEEVSISVTGHSLGSALAMLSAYDLVETGVSGGKTVCVFSFSGPRVGNRAFKERFEGLGLKALRVVNVHDTVPKVPGILFNERVPALVQRLAEGLPWSYCHVGVELALDHKNSPFLKDTGDPSCFHNLEAHLHLLDGYHGKGQRFVLASGRDPALINKACDFLKDHHMVPPYWRQDLNKGMVRSGDGRWVQPERQKMDEHPPDMYHRLMQLGLNLDH
ncbi:phospholipase A1-Igamma1, chloroplastic-like [Dioscorea cayenensis subsp. rotundata]|uniref:Phospholipase A1-Igamma1, chloroplastic-like n=1 Tax=Dioscorea cayennensis subsp. rotundata TaxID=55577 RepID=A0AB40CCE6_DIOCR|nr:phospholipase A1-Igamma1, chloroplastic-like [Dioscorea cayenensis subsp. rotundata]